VSNLVIYAGDDRPIQWPLTDTDGYPLDVTGWTAHAQVRPYPNAPAVLHEWSTANGRAVMANGSVTLLVDDSETYTWTIGEYDLFIVDTHNHWERIDGGRVRIIPAVTKAGT
jgi:hypothetical protein